MVVNVEELLSQPHVRFSLVLRASGLTQREFGDLLDASQVSVSHWATGRRPIPERAVATLARLTEVDPAWLRGETAIQTYVLAHIS